MKHFKLTKPLYGIAPLYVVLIYLVLVSMDFGTTFLASPDLKYEGNWVVRHFHFNWPQLLTFFSLLALVSSLIFLTACNYIDKYYNEKIPSANHTFLYEVFHNKKLIISFFFFGLIYKNIFYTIFIVIQNYLGYVYLFKKDNFLTEIANVYIKAQIDYSPYFLPVIESLFVIATVFFTYYAGKKIRNKYRVLSFQLS